MPVLQQSSEAAITGNLATALLQLGVGGILVLFGAAIYRRFETRADQAVARHALEVKELTDRYEARLKAAEDRHDETRRLYIEALKNSRPVLPSKE